MSFILNRLRLAESRHWGTGLLATLILLGGGCDRPPATKPGGKAETLDKPRSVHAARAAGRAVERVVSVVGALAAYDQATLSTKVAGRLDQMSVDLGSTVRQGETVARIEPRDYELVLKQAEALLAQVRARLGLPLEGNQDHVELEQVSSVKTARAVLDEAAKNRKRIRELSQQGVISQSELETAETSHEVAASRYTTTLEETRSQLALLAQRRAEVDIARQRLTDTAIQAPFDGAVQERKANLGEYLIVGAPVVTLVRMDPLRLRLEVPEREALHVRAGQTVRLIVEGGTNEFTGAIKRLSPAINEQNRMLVVEADVRNSGSLRPGLFVRAEIVIATQDQAITVPPSAVITFAGVQKVFALKDGKAIEKPVVTGRRGEDWVELVKGLSAGETVVLKPGNLRTGQAVIVEPDRPRARTTAKTSK